MLTNSGNLPDPRFVDDSRLHLHGIIQVKMFGATRIRPVVRLAARRRFMIVLIEQSAFALAPVLGAFAILLLLGTQILQWYWLALFALAGLAIALARIRARSLSLYETAQTLDRRLQLKDSLSTAWFLLENESRNQNGMVAFQLQQADELAAAIKPEQAFPMTWHRAWAFTGALAVVAFGLFALRYLVTRSLSLEQSLIPVQFSTVFERLENRLASTDHPSAELAAAKNAQINRTQDNGELPDQKTMGVPQGQAEQPRTSLGTGAAASKDQTESGKSAEDPGREGNSSNAQSEGNKPDQLARDQTNRPNPEMNEKSAGQQGAQGLMDKMKDALSSLMAKMRQNNTQEPQPNGRPSDEHKSGNPSSGKMQSGEQQEALNKQSNQDQNSQGPAQPEAAERAQASQGRSSDSTPEKGADAHSGIGRQNGDKDIKEAEQLQAMGKLAEIIGKRSANVTGEMMLETPSGKQQLKTAYSQKLGHHTDSGGEINRDEIPLADQQYVRDYMELIRKQSKTGK